MKYLSYYHLLRTVASLWILSFKPLSLFVKQIIFKNKFS